MKVKTGILSWVNPETANSQLLLGRCSKDKDIRTQWKSCPYDHLNQNTKGGSELPVELTHKQSRELRHIWQSAEENPHCIILEDIGYPAVR